MNRRLLGIMLFTTLCVFSSCNDDDYTQGQWWSRASYNGQPRAYACSFTIGNKGYLCSGYRGANKDYLTDLWEFDMTGANGMGTWTQLADLPGEGRKGGVGFAVNGKGYITTGSKKDGSSSDYIADTWEYDPSTNTWTQKDDFGGGPRDGALAFSLGNYGYVGTGYNDDEIGWYMDFWRFDPTTGGWTKMEGNLYFSGKKRRYGTAFVINNEAYVCCGENNGTLVVDLWKFDGNNWTQLRDIADTDEDNDYDDDYAIARYSAVSFAINGYGYVATGYRNGVTNDYWRYDPAADLWYGDSDDDFTTLADVHNDNSGGSSRQAAVSFSNGERGYVLTGISGTTYFDDVFELFPDEEEEV